ncbi:MAG TPA: DsbE family thiol:disulfide interchange protein [Gammaproteobacteria bacterium]|nr:DsbE family thiol:disulfide interchange protein [Gammaproteobacteria bacterium]
MWRYVVPIALFGVLGVFLYRGLDRNPSFVPSPLVGKNAPQFSVPLLQDPTQQLTNADFGKDVAILNVWASWCVPCRQEHAYLIQLSKTSNVPIFGIDWNDTRADALAWLKEEGDPYTKTGFDQHGDATINWGVYGAPETFLVDSRTGIILYKHIAPMTPEVWRTEFLPRIEKARIEHPAKGAGAQKQQESRS